MSITKLFLGGNNDVIYKLFPPRESLESDIPAGDGNIEKLFLQCILHSTPAYSEVYSMLLVFYTEIDLSVGKERNLMEVFWNGTSNVDNYLKRTQ
jgi:hypothetical protein